MTEQILKNIALNEVNEKFEITASNLLANHLLITGTTGSGKSTSAVSILTALKNNNQNTIIIDATGEYKNIKNATVAKLGENAFIDYTKIDNNAWANIFDLNKVADYEILSLAILSLRIQKNVLKKTGTYQKINKKWSDYKKEAHQLYDYPQPFEVNVLAQQISEELIKYNLDETLDLTKIGQSRDYAQIALWQKKLQKINNILYDPIVSKVFHLPGYSRNKEEITFDIMYLIALFSTHKVVNKTLVIDISRVRPIGQLDQKIVSIIANSVLTAKKKNNVRPVVLYIDEAHRYIPKKNKKVSENNGIYKILREGRKFGCYLVLATQSPLDVPIKLLGQFGMKLTHRIITKPELRRLNIKNKEVINFKTGQALLQGTSKNQTWSLWMLKNNEKHQTNAPKFK